MEKFNTHTSQAIPLNIANVDTDQIIPARFLKATDKKGFGDNVFRDWRFDKTGNSVSNFSLNNPLYSGSILIAGDNFGCGSSREHAPWALEDYGFRAILAPSYADIFFNNCFKNGLLPIVLDKAIISGLFTEVEANEGYELEVDLEQQAILKPDGSKIEFSVDAFRKNCLLNGLDDIGLTLEESETIRSFEESWRNSAPWYFTTASAATT